MAERRRRHNDQDDLPGERFDRRRHVGGYLLGNRWFPTEEQAEAYESAISARLAPPASYVYFIQSGSRQGPVKIGFAKDPYQRLVNLRVGTSENLDLLAQVPGGILLERQLHAEFAGYRIRGEWFRWSRALKTRIKELDGG